MTAQQALTISLLRRQISLHEAERQAWYQAGFNAAKGIERFNREDGQDFRSKPDSRDCGEDTKRLDWLEQTPFMAYRQIDPETKKPYNHFTLVDERKLERVGIVMNTLREAIDVAMKSQTNLEAWTDEQGREIVKPL